ncbi:MAG: lysylphosphatidylglycerol synthase transmembrane domain-containing protein [Ignavibacteria bacterium]|nr:MAG: lysylphosphatidylglycerol synthase transmembrane domain-containing protein [Ignavibacteria bacterium]
MTSDKIKNSPYIKAFLKYGISLAVAAIFLYIAFYDVNLGVVMDLVSNASFLWIAIFSLTFFLGHVIRTLRWKVILNSVKPNVSFKHLFGALMVGYGVNSVTPKLGEITRAVLLGKWENLSRSSIFGTVIVERVIDIISLGLAVLGSVFIWRENLYNSFPWLETTLYIAGILMLGVILLIYLTVMYKDKFYGFIIRLFSKVSEKLAHKLAYIFEMLTEGFSSLKGTKNYIYTILLTVIILLVYALSSYAGFFMLYMDKILPVTYTMGWVLMSIAAIGVVIPTPGATGSYHILAKSTLVLLFGFGETISAAYAFLTHIISYFLFIFTALIVYFILNKQKNNHVKIVGTDLDEL